jgi:hypothetical protein
MTRRTLIHCTQLALMVVWIVGAAFISHGWHPWALGAPLLAGATVALAYSLVIEGRTHP